MSISGNKCATAAAVAALAVAMYGCSSGSYDLSLGGGSGAGLEAAPDAALGSGEGRTLSQAESAREEAERLVQAAEDAEDVASAAVERLSQEVVAAEANGDDEEAERVRQELDAAIAALEAARGALQAALIVLDVANAQAQAARDALDDLEAAQQDALDAAAGDAGVAWVIELATNDDIIDYEVGYEVGSWSFHWEYALPGSTYASGSRSYRAGGYSGAVLSRDDSGNLVFNTSVARQNTLDDPLQTDPNVWGIRYINTYDQLQVRDGVTKSVQSVDDHGLGSDWQQFDLKQERDGGGTLEVTVFTDVEEDDTLPLPYGGNEFERTILFDDVIDLPLDQDYMYVEVPEDGLSGSLDGVAGNFTCSEDSGGYCSLGYDIAGTATGFYPFFNDTVFTPDDGSEAVELPADGSSESWPYADYLSMGHWLYVPGDATDFDAYDFGVFAGGSDPYDSSLLMTVSGTAKYSGVAAGKYHARLSASSADAGDFNAKVEMTAEFGTNTEMGTIGGRVYDFELDSTAPFTAPLELSLQSDDISEEYWPGDGPVSGGWVWGTVPYEYDDAGQFWGGYWTAKFFGNGIVSTDIPPSFASQPSSVAGTFSARTFDVRTGDSVGLVGSFGANWDEPEDEPAMVLPVVTGNN